MIRVLVVDDSPTVREFLTELLRSDPEIDVVGTASNGSECLARVRDLRPSVVTMDIQMPTMDGISATRQIMRDVPTPIVIVSGNLDVHDARVSFEALQAGAVSLLRRPSLDEGPNSAEERQSFVRTVKAMSEILVVRRTRPVSERDERHDTSRSLGPKRVALVGIAASTGGPAVLCRILSALPKDFRVPIMIVQHMSSGFLEPLAAWLTSTSGVVVEIAVEGRLMLPGRAYLAREDYHLGVDPQGCARLSSDPPIGQFRPAADYLFASIARSRLPAIGVILTGMGQDGTAGLKELRRAGGAVVAQDEATSVVFGMPGMAIAAGLVDIVAPDQQIAAAITSLVESSWQS